MIIEELYQDYNKMYWWLNHSCNRYKVVKTPLLTRTFTDTKVVRSLKSTDELNTEVENELEVISDIVIVLGNKLLTNPNRFTTGYNIILQRFIQDNIQIVNPYVNCEGIVDKDTNHEFVFDIGSNPILILRNNYDFTEEECNLLSDILVGAISTKDLKYRKKERQRTKRGGSWRYYTMSRCKETHYEKLYRGEEVQACGLGGGSLKIVEVELL